MNQTAGRPVDESSDASMNQALPRTLVIDDFAGEPPAPVRDEAGFGFEDLLSIILSQRLFILAVVAMVMVAGAVYLQFRPPVYSATALVALGNPRGEEVNKNPSPAFNPDTALIQSEIEVLVSSDMLGRLINELGGDLVAERLGIPDAAAFKDADPDSLKMRDLVQALQERFSATRQQTSNVIAISFRSGAPDTSVLFANSLVDVYLNSKIDERLGASKRASDWLTQRVEQLRGEVETKEAAVARYRADMKLLSVDGATITEQQFFQLQSEVLTARADLAEKQARMSQLRQVTDSDGDTEAVADALNSPSIQALRARESEIAGRQAELSIRYGDKHPSTLQVRREHAEVLDQITAEIRRIKASQVNEVEISRIRLRSLEGSLSQLEGSLVAGNRAIVRLNELERDALASTSVYQDFLLRAREIAEQESLKVVDARGVSRALEPSAPTTTSPKLWMAFTFAAGLFIGLLAAIVRAFLNDRIVRPEDITRKLGATALVTVPLILRRQLRRMPPDERTPEDYLVNQPMTAFAESMRVLGATLLSDFEKGPGMAVAVTSAVAAEGKTTLSLSLGRAAAMSGLRVLIIDCDARRPSLSAGLSDKPSLSLTDVIRNGVDWKTVAMPDPLTPALVLPINEAPGELHTLFRPESVRKLINQVRPEFDLIVLDCPPILAVAETRWLTAVADATVIVTQWNKTRMSAVRTALREVRRAKGHVAGIVLNRTDVSVTKSFSFSDSLYYGNAGKGYYTR